MTHPYSGSTVPSEQLFNELLKDQAKLASIEPHEVRWHLSTWAKNYGRAMALREWEIRISNIEKNAVEQNWDNTRKFLALTSTLLTAMLAPIDDDCSGRGNDFKRAFADGKREMIQDAKSALDYHFALTLNIS